MTAQEREFHPFKNKDYTGCRNCDARTVEPNCHMTCRVYLNFIDEIHKKKAAERVEKGRHNVFSYTQEKGGYYV